tara:strand:- start:461 stop:1417 length:957 start_codon:yes stop_codon:yes gene_type:complete
MKFRDILILAGGKNEEHEISIMTSKEVFKILCQLGYKVEILNVDPSTFEKEITKYSFDCCFNALHGTFGEDGQIQKILFNHNIPFTHSGILASYKSFNKNQTKISLKNSKINFLKSFNISKNEINKNKLKEIFDQINDFVIKPVSSGSSYGIVIIKSFYDIEEILNNNYFEKVILNSHEYFMIEKYIKGRELTVSVIEDNENSQAVAVTEIFTKNNFFDYKAKYTPGFSRHKIPASLESSIYENCLYNSKLAHDTIGCKGISRSDYIFDEKLNKLYFLEINNQPGLTPISLVPEQLNYKGISYSEMIEKLIQSAKCRE